MAVRNFWIEGQVDGQTRKTLGGPLAKDGGFSLSIKVRDRGEITLPLRIDGYAVLDEDTGETTLTLTVEGKGFKVTEDEVGVMMFKKVTR